MFLPCFFKCCADDLRKIILFRIYVNDTIPQCEAFGDNLRLIVKLLCKAEVIVDFKTNTRFVTTNIPIEGIAAASGELLMSGSVEELCESG